MKLKDFNFKHAQLQSKIDSALQNNERSQDLSFYEALIEMNMDGVMITANELALYVLRNCDIGVINDSFIDEIDFDDEFAIMTIVEWFFARRHNNYTSALKSYIGAPAKITANARFNGRNSKTILSLFNDFDNRHPFAFLKMYKNRKCDILNACKTFNNNTNFVHWLLMRTKQKMFVDQDKIMKYVKSIENDINALNERSMFTA